MYKILKGTQMEYLIIGNVLLTYYLFFVFREEY